ncbi:MAG: cell division protein FtsA [Deltaproteobacteria bacterium]|jgi:cell division protein FtsA|nr:cell division protein FtsA [Deltaproteobacteria bacterium]
MPEHDNYLVGLDIGTTKICCVVAYMDDSMNIDIRGLGYAPATGMVNGRVINIDRTVQAIKTAVNEAESMSGAHIVSAYVGIAGDHIKSINSNGVVVTKGNIITQQDVDRAITTATSIYIPAECEILHTIAQEYRIDGQGGIQNPINLSGNRIEVDVHIVTAAATAVKDVVNCVLRAGVDVNNTILESVASAEAVLSPEEKEMGVLLMDIGGGTSDGAVFVRESIRHTFEIPIGGAALTHDLARSLNLNYDTAEALKVAHGCCLSDVLEEELRIEVPSVGGHGVQYVDNTIVCQLLEERCSELLSSAERILISSAYSEQIGNVVITGGTALLRGIIPLATQIFNRPVRIGTPDYHGGLANIVNNPKFATAIGLVLFGGKSELTGSQGGGNGGGGALGRFIKNLFKKKS